MQSEHSLRAWRAVRCPSRVNRVVLTTASDRRLGLSRCPSNRKAMDSTHRPSHSDKQHKLRRLSPLPGLRRIPSVLFGRTSVMTLQPQLCASRASSSSSPSIFYAAVKPATSLNSRADRDSIRKPCGSHTLRKRQLPPLPHHSKLADAPCD
jgi:hypothetical protein